MIEIVQRTLFDIAESIRARLKRTAEDIIAIGQDLIEAKSLVKDGEWGDWLQSQFEMSQRTARLWMQVAERFGNTQTAIIATTPTVLYELVNSDETIIEKVESGQIPATLPAIREAKQAIVSEIPTAETTPTYGPYVNGQDLREKPPAFPENFGKLNAPDILPRTYPDYVHPLERGLYDAFSEVVAREQVQQIQEQRRIEAKERIDQLREKGVSLPVGKFSCLVVDPPWPMQKIERDVRPNQVEFDYPTMSEDELKAFPLPDMAADDCHLYLWTTQKFLPMALRLAEHWGFKYQCLLTWRKNVGFTPFSWMYSTEHVLFCTKGSLPLLKLGVRLDFEARVREHSRKPDEFYEIVREVSPGPRIDVFSREKRDGFEQYGNEVEKYVSA